MKLQTELFGASFQNPVSLASGMCGFGLEIAEVVNMDTLGGSVTKSVTLLTLHTGGGVPMMEAAREASAGP